MGFWDWLIPISDDDDSDSDTELLYEVGERWLEDASRGDDETASIKWEAVERIDKETQGGFWSWLTGR